MNPDLYGKPAGTALRMPEIKLYLYETTGKQLEAAGFKFNKSVFRFTRKHKKNYEQFIFNFYNGFPLMYDVRFGLRIWNDRIQQILQAFPYQQTVGNFAYCSIMAPMGDFVDESIIKAQLKKRTGLLFDREADRYIVKANENETGQLTRGQVSGFAYELYNSTDLFKAADAMNDLLQNQLLHLSDQLASVDGIDKFFAARPGWSVKTSWLSNMGTELIAAKLNDQRDYHQVYSQLAEAIDSRIEKGEMSIDYKSVLDVLHNYI